jgi:peptidoglycan/xylan/chitin deacetylase (PgdA/CDA1 family)
MSRGALVVSLDFEMAWGNRRSPILGASEAELLRGTRTVVTRLLEIFDRYGVSATWATVGHLMMRREDFNGGRFDYNWQAPRFAWFQGGWYEGIPAFGEDGADVFYAPDLVEKIVNCPTYQELGAHTFSHIDVGDEACPAETARAEFSHCQRLAQRWGRKLNSVVFPHNYAGHLDVLEETGYRCYRGLNCEWYLFGLNWNKSRRAARAIIQPMRYLDEKWPICPPLPSPRRVGRLWEIPHSMFFPGLHGISRYISPQDRVNRAVRGLKRAVERGRLFSLWTHPENMLVGADALLGAFEEICKEAAAMRDAGKLDILPMEEATGRLEAGKDTWSD